MKASPDMKVATYQCQIDRLHQLDRDVSIMKAAIAGQINRAWVKRRIALARFNADLRRKTSERDYLVFQMTGVKPETIYGPVA